MIIRIDGTVYEGAEWSVEGSQGTLLLPEIASLSDLEELFTHAVVIDQLDGEEVVGRWYSQKITGIMVNPEASEWKVSVTFKTTTLSVDDTEALEEYIGENDGAIVELAELAADTADKVDNLTKEVERDKTQQHETDQGQNRHISGLEGSLGVIRSDLNKLTDRVSDIENFLNERFGYIRKH